MELRVGPATLDFRKSIEAIRKYWLFWGCEIALMFGLSRFSNLVVSCISDGRPVPGWAVQLSFVGVAAALVLVVVSINMAKRKTDPFWDRFWNVGFALFALALWANMNRIAFTIQEMYKLL